MDDLMNWALAHGGLYAGVTLILLLCGLGVPLPEEGVFLAAGWYGAKQPDTNVWVLCACGVLGILLGDSIPYWVGRRYGLSFIKRKPFSWVLNEKGIDKTRVFFSKHGSKAVFCGRFVAGLRMPMFFMAGSMGVSYPGFIFWDLLGAFISCPVSIYLAYHYGHAAEEMLSKSKPFLFGAIAVVVLYVIYHIWSHREKPDATTDVKRENAVPVEANATVQTVLCAHCQKRYEPAKNEYVCPGCGSVSPAN